MAYIYRNPHRQALQAIDQELQQRTAELQNVQRRIVELTEARKAVLPLAQQEVDEEITASLPTLCLRVLSLNPDLGVSVPKVRDGLRLMGIELMGKNPLAILHTTLGRLAKSGLVFPITTGLGEATHYQISPAGLTALQQEF